MRFGMQDGAEGAVLDKVFNRRQRVHVTAIVADGEHDTRFPASIERAPPAFKRQRQRLLDEDVDAGSHGGDDLAVVPVRRDTKVEGIYAKGVGGGSEQVGEAGECTDSVESEALNESSDLRLFEIFGKGVAECDDPGAVDSRQVTEMLQATLAKTDQTDSNWLYQTGIPRVSCACYRRTTTPNLLGSAMPGSPCRGAVAILAT